MVGKVVCFGELLLRLGAPGRELLLQSPQLQVNVGGAEANVAVALASFGHDARFVSVVADNTLGTAALMQLRGHGVDTSAVQRGEGRMGLYFLSTGAVQRPSQVLYDREDSAFVRAGGGEHDWATLLAGADWLHVSGVTLALGKACHANAVAAIRQARAMGVKVSFDGNFRPQLWQRWEPQDAIPSVLHALMSQADLLLASHRDIEVALGRRYEHGDATARFEAAARDAFDAFPHLQRMAATTRGQRSVDHQVLAAVSLSRDCALVTAPAQELAGIVDRIGTGDAFAAGVLHGMVSGMDEAAILRFGLAAGCLKHSVPGDFLPLGVAEVEAAMGEGGFDVRR
ncbi:2-dehydro-3-deoxygluconokinase [Pseudoxanthomonas indica]|uniref:2-dehydro-3-deoxygluconokinase n=2 Tax=Pseudoxanthomonas indica TaxID=428993 RepID=A0A1T5K2N4_9GAMM|nr:2-keto-3-deoxygluconate kinase [Pseudoxanthomonas indica]SKC57946.1 2-dehydro-3-deoxygluconokinase [Pseudoxanthomonas indica]